MIRSAGLSNSDESQTNQRKKKRMRRANSSAARVLVVVIVLSALSLAKNHLKLQAAKYECDRPAINHPNDNETAIIPIKKNESTTSLEFVHITKTGGTSIEAAAAKAGIAWGRCKFIRIEECLALNHTNIPFESKKKWACKTPTQPWHCPPCDYRNDKDVYNGSKTFTIVRNPYDRMVSEYYYYWGHSWKKKHNRKKRYGSKKPGPLLNKPESMNVWVQQQLEQVKEKGSCFSGHCIPMHKYTHWEDGEPMVDHVLYLENITMELPILLKQYGIEKIKMGHDNVRRESDKLDASHFTDETICRINQWARLDFEYFEYDKIVPFNGTRGGCE